MTMDVHAVLPSPVFKPNILGTNGKIDARVEFKPYLNGYRSRHQQQQQQPKMQNQQPFPGFSLNPACACLLMFESLVRYSWLIIRTVLVIVNNLYCIPTYTVWMFLLLPLKALCPQWYWKIEGRLFHWLLSMVTLWSYSAGYHIMESGDRIDRVAEKETLVLANHQSTSDVPLLMAAFNTREKLLPNLTWIMDHIFKFTNFGVVSAIHGDFFVVSGKDSRERTILELSKYLNEVYIPRDRKWIVLFPEGGFLYKRREISQRYAEKNKLPHLEHVTIPRMGAVQAIIDGVGPKYTREIIGDVDRSKIRPDAPGKLKYILDITIGYPNKEPLDILAILSSYLRPCSVHIHYRLFPMEEVPTTPAEFQDWLFKIYADKETMLASFYENGKWSPTYDRDGTKRQNPEFVQEPVMVNQDLLRMAVLHSFFILSTIFHVTVLRLLYTEYLMPWF